MFRTALWTLRQPRYAALAALMVLVAAACVAAGTWQIARFQQSVRDNDALKANAHAATVALTPALVPLVGHGAAPGRDQIRFRTVTATGQYLGERPQFLRNQSLDGVNGYYVLDPLRTGSGVLLVARGFVAADAAGAPPTVAIPPTGPVTVTGRLENATTKDDAAARLGSAQLETVNPAQQAARLGAPVYQGYLVLTAGSPGTRGVSVLPDPDLSNPAGGAYEAQHFAYIIQWYLFALLALAAPFAISRSERRDAQRRFLGIDPDNEEFGLDPTDGPTALAGRPGADASGAVAVRADGAVVRAGVASPEQWQQAANLADRYGRSLGPGHEATTPGTAAGRAPRRARPMGVGGPLYTMPNSATAPHRSADGYQGVYNDHLWQLALADGLDPAAPTPRTGADPAGTAAPDDGSPLLPPPGPVPITGGQLDSDPSSAERPDERPRPAR